MRSSVFLFLLMGTLKYIVLYVCEPSPYLMLPARESNVQQKSECDMNVT